MPKRFCYLGYELKENNGHEFYLRKVVDKAMAILGGIWSIDERPFKEDWEKESQIFDALVRSVLLYGAQIWDYEEEEDLEKKQLKYIKWVLKLDRCTSGHIILQETGRDRISLRVGTRAARFEKLLNLEKNR